MNCNIFGFTPLGLTAIFKFQFIAQSSKSVILSDRRESKDLGTYWTANVIIMRRFFDFVLRTPLRMTYLVVRCKTER